MPAVPDKNLHANRPFSIPTDDGPKNCFSRSDILTGKTPSAFGSSQSAGITTDGESSKDPATWPKLWPRQGRLLKVPKCVILSSFPFWTLYWPTSYFYFPRDVIGDTGLGFLGNYYYFDQWNGLDQSITDSNPDYSFLSNYDLSDPQVVATIPGSSAYQNNQAWSDMAFLNPADKTGVYNAYANCLASTQDGSGCDAVPQYLINKCPIPPTSERYFQGVCQADNPYYSIHPQILNAFLQAKAILENDPVDPIYVVIPNWMPQKMYQVRNASLKQRHENLNRAHGGAINGRPCAVVDVNPCYIENDICWAPPYPDKNDPRNAIGFNAPQVPWLMSMDPGFGTNVLHLYVGHPNLSYEASSNFYDYQAWPLTPELQWIAGPIATGNYLGSGVPFFSGRRAVWRMSGFDYGYANHGAEGLYDTVYGPIVGQAAATYKTNFWNFRNFATRLFTYDAQWNFSWDFTRLYNDRRDDCPATQFYFGFDFATFAAIYTGSSPDNQIFDCSQVDHIKDAETQNFFPDLASINQAINVGKSLSQRVESYYNGNDPGAADFFQLAIDRNGLADYNVSYEGVFPGAMLDPDGIAAYVRDFFNNQG